MKIKAKLHFVAISIDLETKLILFPNLQFKYKIIF